MDWPKTVQTFYLPPKCITKRNSGSEGFPCGHQRQPLPFQGEPADVHVFSAHLTNNTAPKLEESVFETRVKGDWPNSSLESGFGRRDPNMENPASRPGTLDSSPTAALSSLGVCMSRSETFAFIAISNASSHSQCDPSGSQVQLCTTLRCQQLGFFPLFPHSKFQSQFKQQSQQRANGGHVCIPFIWMTKQTTNMGLWLCVKPSCA